MSFTFTPPPPIQWRAAASEARTSVKPAPELVEMGGHLSTVQPPTMMSVDVSSVTASTTKGAAQSPPYGRLEMVTPMSLDMTAIPRGRVYAELWATDAGGAPMACFWRGYLQTSGDMVAGISSTPGAIMYPSWRLQAVVTQSDQGAATRIGFHCHIQPDVSQQAPSGFIHDEEPLSGEGEEVTVSLAAPAAGADYADKTVPAATKWRVESVFGTLTTSAAVADRQPRILYRTGGTTVGTHGPQVAHPASTTASWMFGRDLTLSSVLLKTPTVPITPRQLPAGTVVRLTTLNIDAADQWSAGTLVVRAWAVPA